MRAAGIRKPSQKWTWLSDVERLPPPPQLHRLAYRHIRHHPAVRLRLVHQPYQASRYKRRGRFTTAALAATGGSCRRSAPRRPRGPQPGCRRLGAAGIVLQRRARQRQQHADRVGAGREHIDPGSAALPDQARAQLVPPAERAAPDQDNRNTDGPLRIRENVAISFNTGARSVASYVGSKIPLSIAQTVIPASPACGNSFELAIISSIRRAACGATANVATTAFSRTWALG
jgi:hypothetical protein